jgi:hypothetical protein
MKKVFDFFDTTGNAVFLVHGESLADPTIAAVAHAELALVRAVVERTYFKDDLAAVVAAMDRLGVKSGEGVGRRLMAESFIEGRCEVLLRGPVADAAGSTVDEHIPLRSHSVGEQASADYPVDRACDALARATSRMAHSRPELARRCRRALLADDERAYQDLRALATTAVGRRAISDVRGALTRAENDLAKRV